MSNKNSLPPGPITPTTRSTTTPQTPDGQKRLSYVPLAGEYCLEQLKQLSDSAKALNALSDELTTVVADIEMVLNKLNLGIRAHINAETLEQSDADMYWRGLRLAYGKGASKWGFIIEEVSEDWNNPENSTYESWHFKDAPREFRLKVVEKIPALLEALVKQSSETALEITKKTDFAKQVATTILNSSHPNGSKR